jgi:hypothetical protein
VVTLLLLCLATAGCGQSEDRAQATEVGKRFFSAMKSGDGATACDQLSADTRKALEKDEQKPCPEAIADVRIEPGAIATVELFLNNAKLDLDNGDSAFLSLTANGWRLSAVGCKPGDGAPTEVPMDCELEA